LDFQHTVLQCIVMGARSLTADRRRRPVRWIALSLICAAAAGVVATAATARTAEQLAAPSLATATTGSTPPLRTGLQDPIYSGAQKAAAFAMTRDAGVTYVRLMVPWASIAPATLPQSGFIPTDPTSPYYDWTAIDATVAAAEAAGLTPILNLVRPAPSWAYSVQPTKATGGTPDTGDLGDFATAVATHYAGSVHVYSVWNEPNFNRNLYPQNPATYRAMVNAVAASVHAVDPTSLVVAGELAPFKHTPNPGDTNSVIPPITFMRQMLCVTGTGARTCSATVHFDVWSHHPYSVSGPFARAKVTGGVELGDLPKMKALLDLAQQVGAIDSANPVQFWVTEFAWSSKPPNTKGTPMNLETRWVAESLYQIWKSGATVGTWFLLQDMPLSTPFQSGLYFISNSVANADAKPYLTSFRFPFVAYLKSGGKVAIWGRDTTSDKQTVTIERKTSNGWKPVGAITSNDHGIFQATLAFGAKKTWTLRASAPGSGTSSTFSLTVPSNENMTVNPFPLSG